MKITTSKDVLLFRFENVQWISMYKTDRGYEMRARFNNGQHVVAYGKTPEDTFEAMKEAIRT